jgi:hypothetical protein
MFELFGSLRFPQYPAHSLSSSSSSSSTLPLSCLLRKKLFSAPQPSTELEIKLNNNSTIKYLLVLDDSHALVGVVGGRKLNFRAVNFHENFIRLLIGCQLSSTVSH